MLQDHDGNIWVGTQAGLTRITEATITSTTTREGATAENLQTLIADADGGVWVETPGGLVACGAARARDSIASRGEADDHHRHARGSRRDVLAGNGGRRPVPPRRPTTSRLLMAGRRHRPRSRRSTRTAAAGSGRSTASGSSSSTRRPACPRESRCRPRSDAALRSAYRMCRTGCGSASTAERSRVRRGSVPRVFGARRCPAEHQWHPAGLARPHLGWTDNGLSTFTGRGFVTLTTANGLPRDRVFFRRRGRRRHLWVGIGSGVLRIEQRSSTGRSATQRISSGTSLRRSRPARHAGSAGSARRDTRARRSIWFVTSTGISIIIDPRRLSGRSPSACAGRRGSARGRSAQDASRACSCRRGLESADRILRAEPQAPSKICSPPPRRDRHRLDGRRAPTGMRWYAHWRPARYTFPARGDDRRRGVGPSSRSHGRSPSNPPGTSADVLRGLCPGRLVRRLVRVAAAHPADTEPVRRRPCERARVGREIHDTLRKARRMALQIDNVSTQLDAASQPVKDELARMRHQVSTTSRRPNSRTGAAIPRLDAAISARCCARRERITKKRGRPLRVRYHRHAATRAAPGRAAGAAHSPRKRGERGAPRRTVRGADGARLRA